MTVASLGVSVAFYRDVIGLDLAYLLDDRRVAFLWIGGRGHCMLGLWEVGTSPNLMRLHLAFESSIDDVLSAPRRLRAANIIPRGISGQQVDEAVVLGWMPAIAIYFTDPDGHLLEFLAMLPDEPNPERGVVSYSEWKSCTEREARFPKNAPSI